MALILEVIGYKGLPPSGVLSACFDRRGGTIGRSAENHLALPDEDKLVSRHHAEIAYENGAYVLSDTSSGGTWLRKEGRFLTQASVPLADGDQIKIGDYELRARIAAEEVADFEVFAGQAGLFAAPSAPSPFGGGVDMPPLPFDRAPPPPLTPGFAEAEPSPSFIGQADAAPFQESFAPLAVRQEGGAAPAAESFAIEDLFASVGDSPFAQSATPPPAEDSGADWLDQFLPADAGAKAQPPQPAPPFANDPPPAARPVEVPAPPVPPPFDTPQVAPPAEKFHIPTPRGRVGQPTPVAAATPKSVAPPPGVDLFQCFLQGAGLEDFPAMNAEQQAQAMRLAGMAYREMVAGLMQVLRARTEEKRELRRTDVTMIQARKNNPLKFLPTADDALKVMVANTHPSYIGPTEAVEEGFTDIMNHQLAMRAGMQAALGAFLQRLKPEAIEERFKDGIVFQKKAKCWDAYGQAYPQLVNEAMDDLFGDAFTAAYREQMRVLRNTPKNR
ncbi:MAG: type VI secretion system-associated FHA domain protein TagH [Candidatus Methylumidiphilus sp.]